MNNIQKELDLAEEYILNKVLGSTSNPVISNKLQLIMLTNNFNLDEFVNSKLLWFENISKPLMTEEGYYDGAKLTSIIVEKCPSCLGIELPTIKPLELIQLLDILIGFDNIGNFIRNF